VGLELTATDICSMGDIIFDGGVWFVSVVCNGFIMGVGVGGFGFNPESIRVTGYFCKQRSEINLTFF
jgi:hypothetical protein